MQQIKKSEKLMNAEFETAIKATNFGTFNYLLLLMCVPATWTLQFESTLTSYIIPAAVCDLKLNSTQKGLLNSMPFIGMLATGFFCGFLMDTLGRRKFLLYGYSFQVFVILGKTFSSNVLILSIFSFLGGCTTGGLYIALTTYIMEFHSADYRGKVQMFSGMMYAIATIFIPLISSFTLPLNFHMNLRFTEIHSWNILILISCANPLIAVISLIYFLPETPKFLMSIGNNEEALGVLRKMYQLNTNKNQRENYSIYSLIEEIKNREESAANTKTWNEYFFAGWKQIRPIFNKANRFKLLIICIVQSLILMGMNSFRLYLPQIFQAAHEYQLVNNKTSSYAPLCNILNELRYSINKNKEDICAVHLEHTFAVYLNSMIIAATTFAAYALGGILINLCEKPILLGILGITASIAGFSLILSPNVFTTLTMSGIFLSSLNVFFDIFLTIVVVLFPTTLRATAISITLFFGRLLTIVGNMILPILIDVGCEPPFLFLGSTSLVAVCLCFTIAKRAKEDMK